MDRRTDRNPVPTRAVRPARLLAILLAAALLSPTHFDRIGAEDIPVGSIQGRIHDKETGDSIAFADVILVGTGKGTITGQDGTFRFVQIPAGIYQVRVNRMGYGSELVDQVRVEAGYANKVSVGMDPIEVREVEVIEVSGLRDLVDVEVAQTSHYVTADEIKDMAVTVIDDVVSKQAGVVEDEGGLYIRGGRAEDRKCGRQHGHIAGRTRGRNAGHNEVWKEGRKGGIKAGRMARRANGRTGRVTEGSAEGRQE